MLETGVSLKKKKKAYGIHNQSLAEKSYNISQNTEKPN